MLESEVQQEDKLRELAYKLWEEAGRPSGRQEEFWQQAEERLAQEKQEKRHVPNDDLDAAGKDSFPASDPVNHT